MNGNFDFNTNINDMNGDIAELTPIWEIAEADYISAVEYEWWEAICADDYAWEVRAEELHAIVREAEEILAGYGIRPNADQMYERYGYAY